MTAVSCCTVFPQIKTGISFKAADSDFNSGHGQAGIERGKKREKNVQTKDEKF